MEPQLGLLVSLVLVVVVARTLYVQLHTLSLSTNEIQPKYMVIRYFQYVFKC